MNDQTNAYNNMVFHVISNTHWDREWRFPFQRNRQMLVDMIDKLLDILENEPDYRAFHLDSQSIVLKDYLEIKPYKKDLIIQLTKENRLLHGPWYILPEEFQVGGENLVRNLLIGHKVSKENGGVSKIGYSPFSWGQISQLPQIYKQFNINLIMFYRGINSLDSPKAEFLWEGADKTRMVSSRFSTMPRYNFYFFIYRPAAHNEGFFDVEYDWKKDTTPFHFADGMQQDEDYFIVSPHNQYFPENIEKQVSKIIEDQANDFTTPHKIWMEGHDSSGPNRQTVDIINDIRKKFPGIDVRHSTLEEYADHIANDVNVDDLKLVTGERRSAQNNNRCGNLFGYTTSARMYLKQTNFDAERWLQFYAEPFNVFSGLTGRDIQDQYPEVAWELIVQNSAHDSIGGCSLDPIHEDMMMRYKHAMEISKGIFERAMKHLVAKMNTEVFPTNSTEGIFLTVVNPVNHIASGAFEVFVDIPVDIDLGDFDIITANGERLDKSILWRNNHQPVLEQMINRPMFLNMVRYCVYVSVDQINGFSMKTLQVLPKKQALPANVDAPEDFILENEYLRVEVNTDGSLNLTEKKTGKKYNNIAWFEDHGEGGHAWVTERVEPTVATIGKPVAGITRTISSILFNQIVVSHDLEIPADLSSRKNREDNHKITKVDLFVSLARGQKFVDLKVKVDNQSESHRLRMMIPTRLKAKYSWGEGQFDVVQRTLERPDTSDWIEQPMYDFPMHHFVDVSDHQNGIAALVDGLKEYEVLDDPDKTLAITLLRTFEYKINPSAPQDYSWQKGSQMMGKSEYHLALYPHEGDWHEGDVFQQAYLFNYPVRWVQTGRLSGSLGAQQQFMNIEPEALVFDTLKKSEDGNPNTFVLRLHNPRETVVNGRISFFNKMKKVQKVTLEEMVVEDMKLGVNNSDFEIVIKPKEIVSYRIEF